jgi:drug/metabolite transporter (DMT)-like permease
MIMALRRAEASRVTPYIYLQLVWAMLSTVLVFGVTPRPTTLLGTPVVVGSELLLYRLDARERAAARRAA